MIKKLLLTVLLLLFAFYGKVNAQCTITNTLPTIAPTYVPASFYAPTSLPTNLPCNKLSGCNGVLYIGDGTEATTLKMDSNLDLTCLGAIQLIVRKNAGVDFGSNNYNLTLAAGSSIIVETGSRGFFSSNNCSASDLIKIGNDNFASCNGGGNGVLFEFDNLNSNTQNSIITSVSPTSACGSGIFTLSVSNPSSNTNYNYSWYYDATGGASFSSGDSYTTPSISSTTTYYVQRNYNSSYSTARVPVTAIVNPLPTTPSVGIPIQPTCATPTGSVVLSDLPASGTWTLTRSPGGITTSGTGTSTTISGLAGGTYTYTVTNASGCTSSPSANVNINAFVAVTNTWNGPVSRWSAGSPPTSDQTIVFNSLYVSNSTDGNLVGCSCQANAGVTVNSGYTITLTNSLTVASGIDMVFKSGSSLVQINNGANSGIIKYQRISRSLNTDYTYWSSPVSDQTLYDLNPAALAGTSYSYEQTPTSENWVNAPGSTTMVAGKGYIIRGREGTQTPPELNDVEFAGIPNNGDVPVPVPNNSKFSLVKDDPDLGVSYLLGNPYPSAIDADKFLTDNADFLKGTIYFWTHNTAIQDRNLISNPGSGAFAYTSNDYATYNITGGVGIDSGTSTGPSIGGATTPNGKIAAGQGFFATAKAPGTVTFTNTMRRDNSGNPYDNSQFFKTRNSKTEKVIEKNRIWLNLTNTQGAFKQTLVGYITNATNDYDDRFDGESFDGNEFVDFYSVNQDKNLTIQGRALPFDENDEVPLGYRTTINGAFTINIDQVDGSLTNQAVFIEDKLTNTVTDLKSGNYTFNTIAGTFNDRFVLRYKNTNTNKTLATDTFDSLENKVIVSNKNKQIKINSFTETIEKVTIYDLLGRQIYQKEKVNSNELSIANLVSSRQTLVVKTVLQNGQEVSKKIIY